METKKLRIIGYPWHLGHQYELSKLPFVEWSWLMQYKRKYSKRIRNDFMTNWVPYYEKGKYDLALLHLDQQCVDEELQRRGKASLYMNINEVIKDIPKIVIQHGTPYYPEKFTKEFMIQETKKLIGDNVMVTNSKTAAKQWGFGTPIIHGLDPKEWFDLTKEPRIVTVISPAGLDKYYDRTFLRAVRERLEEQSIMMCHITVDFRASNWDEYRKLLGSSLIYFNPTRESPMPRSRTEAMLSGCCVITTPHQDADTFIKHGINGLICKRNPDHVIKLINWCMDNYKEAIKIGQKGKETAKEVFSMERYQNDWKKLMYKTIEDYGQRA